MVVWFSMTLNKCGMKQYCRFFFAFEFLLCTGISSAKNQPRKSLRTVLGPIPAIAVLACDLRRASQAPALFAPGMKMIADVDGIEARLFRRHRVFEQLMWRVLLRARFPTEFDGHDLLLARF
jgi:hypothetical protein